MLEWMQVLGEFRLITLLITLLHRGPRGAMSNEANTCRIYVLPKLYGAGWSNDAIDEQYTFTAGQIRVSGQKARRGEPKRADYLLRYKKDFPIAVVEAKASYKLPSDGMQQAIEYARILGLSFAYATNGNGIVEFDFTTGLEQAVENFPTPKELWNRWRVAHGMDEALEDKFLVAYHVSENMPRYYQQIAINRAVEAILNGQKRLLLNLATGTGKTVIAFQIAWKLTEGRWNNMGYPYRKPRILFLADRALLVDDPKDKTFSPFKGALHKIIRGNTSKNREMYFSTYQAIAEDEQRPGLYRDYPADFFDLIIVDEAHRGSAREDSTWREILEYFAGAAQLGMTATPLREDNRDTYAYFGEPLYVYSLSQGIQDGFLAPHQVRRVVEEAARLKHMTLTQGYDLATDIAGGTRKLAEVCVDITDGTHVTPRYVEHGVPFVSIKDMSGGFIDFSNVKYILPEEHAILSRRCKPEYGDILLSKVGSNNGMAVVVNTHGEFSIFVSLALIKLDKTKLESRFAEHMLNSTRLRELSETSTRGVGYKNLVLKFIREFPIPVPPLEEQRRIVAYLDELQGKVDRLKALQRETGAELEALLPSILDKAFKGEL